MAKLAMTLHRGQPRAHGCRSAFAGSSTGRDSYIKAVSCHANAVTYDLPSTLEIKKAGQGSAAFRATSPRLSYISQERRFSDASYDLPGMATQSTYSKHKGTSMFRGQGGRDSYVRATQRSGPAASYDTRDTIADAAKRGGPTAAFRSNSPAASARDSHIKAVKHSFVDASYDVTPRRAATPANSSFRGNSNGRDAYIKDVSKRFNDVSYDLKGMAEQPSTPRAATSSFKGDSRRDSHIRAVQTRMSDVHYDLRGIGDVPKQAVSSGSFRSKSPRHSYVEAQPKFVDASYDLKGIADGRATTPANSAFKGSAAPRDSYVRAQRLGSTDLSYNLKGIGDISRSPGASSMFRSSSRRGSHIDALKGRFVDAVYDVPGIGSA